MAKMSCFSFLLGGKNKRSKVIRSKVAYAKKATGNDCPKVKPVEFMDMADTVDVSEGGGNAPACDTNVFVRTDAEPARHKASSKRDSCAAGEDSSGYSSGDNSKNVVSVGRMSLKEYQRA